jgi:TonB family protein
MKMFVARMLAVLLAAAAAAPAAAEAQRSEWRRSSACSREPHREPRRTPAEVWRDSLHEHVTAAIRADILRAVGEAGLPAEGLVLAQYDQDTRTGRMWSVQGRVAPRVLSGAYERAIPLLAAYPAGERGDVVLHFRLDSLPLVLPRVGEVVVECRPDVTNVAEVRRLIEDFARQGPSATRSPARVRALVARDGQVVFVELARSSGNARLDAFAREMFETMRFAPASINGVPVDTWVAQPVEVQSSRAP